MNVGTCRGVFGEETNRTEYVSEYVAPCSTTEGGPCVGPEVDPKPTHLSPHTDDKTLQLGRQHEATPEEHPSAGPHPHTETDFDDSHPETRLRMSHGTG